MRNADLLQLINAAYDEITYPDGFADQYVIMECLAERNGIDTFLVQKRGDAPMQFVAKCYDRSVWSIDAPAEILRDLEHPGLPRLMDTFEDDRTTVTVREYVKGQPLDQYALEHELSEQDVIHFCLQLCDILAYLHHRPDPIIHRDIKPQNVIVGLEGQLSLIDFDIARVYRSGNDTDTRFFGTVAYAPPEQYGFSQTDARADIYSLGILLRYLLTGSTRENKMVRVYKPLAKVISRCTAFAPEKRYADVDQVKKALRQANPSAQKKRLALFILCTLLAAAILVFAGYKIYEKVTYDPFAQDVLPAYTSDEERITDAVQYMKETYHTDLFDDRDALATFGLIRTFLTDCMGLDHDYVYKVNTGRPEELEDCFFPWGYPDTQFVDRDVMLYVAVKLHDPSIVADWSSLKDDTGVYPGTRVALAFNERAGITTGVNRPDDITVGEAALILANADRVFKAAGENAALN